MSTTEGHGVSLGSGFSNTVARGVNIYVSGSAMLLNAVNKDNSCNGTRAVLKTSGDVEIATASFSGNTATFSAAQSLDANTKYNIYVDNNGSSYTLRYANSVTYPIYETDFYWHSSNGGANTDQIFNVESINYDLQTNYTFTASSALSLSTSVPDEVVVVSLQPLAISGTLAQGTVTTASVDHYGGGTVVNSTGGPQTATIYADRPETIPLVRDYLKSYRYVKAKNSY